MAWTYSPVHTGNLPGLNVYTAPSKYAGFSAYSSPVISIFLMCWLCCIRCVFCWWPARFDRFLLPLVTTVEFSGPVPALAVVPTACLTAGRCSIRPCTSAFPFLWRNGLDVFDLDSSEEYRLVIFVECLPSVVLSVSSWLNSSSGLCQEQHCSSHPVAWYRTLLRLIANDILFDPLTKVVAARFHCCEVTFSFWNESV